MFAAFEKLVKPYPDGAPALPPRGFGPFVWACSHGLRRYIALMTLFTAAIGVFEALLFAMLGRIVDWLGPVQPAQLWARARHHAAAAGCGAAGQHAAGGAAVDVQAPGAGRQLPDAAALELPPPDAAAEHELLPGRVRRAHRHQGDADGAGGARRLDDPGRHPGLRADLLRHHGGGGRRLRRLAAAALRRLGAAVHRGAALLRAAAGAQRRRRRPTRAR